MDFEIPEGLKQIQMMVRRFVREEMQPLEQMVEEKHDFPSEIRTPLVKRALELGFRQMGVSQKYGGAEIGALGQVLASEEMGWVSEAVNYGILAGEQDVLGLATDEQRERYFLPALNGDREGCTAWSEPNAAGDAAGIQTRAVRNGKGWILNGTKHFITRADKSDFAIVSAITDPDKPKSERFTQFIVDFDTPGFNRETYQPMMGRYGLKSWELSLQDCVVSEDSVLGEVGGALRRQLARFGMGRLMLGARMVGAAQRAMDMAKSYAKQRHTFGQPLASRQAVQWMLVDMGMNIHAARIMTYHAAWEIDQEAASRPAQMRQAMVKLYTTQMACSVIDNAIQIHGGVGYSKMLPLERMYRDARLYRIAEGPDEMMKHVIARYMLELE
jgi:acyl-CoA dehydrogenase